MFQSVNVVHLFALFFSKFGALVVGIFFLPVYSKYLGPDAFGIVAVILSIQAFALIADFGLSTLVGRDIAQQDSTIESPHHNVRLAQCALTVIYAGVFVAALAIGIVAPRHSISPVMVGLCVLLVYFSVLQNILQTALLAKRRFSQASAVQVSGVVARAALTTVCLSYWSNTLETFLFVQCLLCGLHALATNIVWRLQTTQDLANTFKIRRTEILELLKRGRPLLLAGIAGAAVLQLDKPIVSALMSPPELAPYFLATSFSILPTSLLAAPVVQYFQPQIIKLASPLTRRDVPATSVRNFTITLFIVVALPSFLIWQWSPFIIELWLHGSTDSAKVALYARILLPAFALGSLSYVPVILLLAVQDFRYQAATSIALTILTLIGVSIAASFGDIKSVCFVYFLYYCTASMSVWFRAISLSTIRPYAISSARVSLKLAAALLFIIASTAIFLR